MAVFLRIAASIRPLVLVQDDLHAADTPSLLLLQFVAGEVAEAHHVRQSFNSGLPLARYSPVPKG
jgi:predicted ATPase